MLGKKFSSTILIQIMARVLLMIDPSGVLFYLFLPAASLLHELPHSRETEIEADHIGVYLASEACFDPRAASWYSGNVYRPSFDQFVFYHRIHKLIEF
jgi:Zn-dependent protease with chaperone function